MARDKSANGDVGHGGTSEAGTHLQGADGSGSNAAVDRPGITARERVEALAGRTDDLTVHFDDLPIPDPSEIAESLLDTAVKNWGHPGDPLRVTHPVLADFLFAKSWNGIAPRDPGVITIAVRPTGCNVTLKMPSEAQSVTIGVSHIGQAFDALERCLRTRCGDWKELKSGPGAQKLREDRKKLLETRKSKK